MNFRNFTIHRIFKYILECEPCIYIYVTILIFFNFILISYVYIRLLICYTAKISLLRYEKTCSSLSCFFVFKMTLLFILRCTFKQHYRTSITIIKLIKNKPLNTSHWLFQIQFLFCGILVSVSWRALISF